jgi:hypothetical protein
LRFRFTASVSSTSYSDVLYITLPSNGAQQPFTPVNNNNDLIVQFLPALGPGDRDFSVGFFSDAILTTSGSQFQYQIQMRYGGLVGGRDYMLQISEYNTVNSKIYMSTSPNRQLVTWDYAYYPASLNYRYRDAFYIKSHTSFLFAQLLHTTTTVSDYETITINYKPNGALAAASANN